MRTGYIGWHVAKVDMYYWKTCGSGGHVFHGISIMGGHVQ